MEEDPFPDLKISSSDFLDDIPGRHPCKYCGKSRKYYCYTCLKPLSIIAERIPLIELPVHVDIIKHPKEVDGKSTSVHAALLAPKQVNVYTYPEIPDYEEKDKVVLVFPGDKSQSLEDLLSNIGNNCKESDSLEKPSNVENDSAGKKRLHHKDIDSNSKKPRLSHNASFHTVVFIDSTWNQTTKIILDERLKEIPQVKIETRTTKFWRHQRGKPSTYLATIEAIYFFMRDFHEAFIEKEYDGDYDDLLFFFMFMYKKIRILYKDDSNKLKAYKDQPEHSVNLSS